MNDWLDIMLEEIDRKKRESEEAKTEAARRSIAPGESGQHQKEDTGPVKM